MPVEVGGAEERRVGILNQRELVALGLHPEHDDVGVAFPGGRILGVGLRGTEEHERLATDLVNRIALGPLESFDMRHPQRQPMNVSFARGSLPHLRDDTAAIGSMGDR